MKEGKDAKDSAEIRVKVDELLSYVESQQETDEESICVNSMIACIPKVWGKH
ncbi:MAG: hypothetical protein R3B54_07270 [Bdellovibrionota bacterium]